MKERSASTVQPATKGERSAGPVPKPEPTGNRDTQRALNGPSMARPAGGWIVEDEADPLPGQMRRTQFMALLRRSVCQAADEGLAPSGRDSAGCPWIEHWLGYYEGRGANQIDRAIRKFAPETALARGAAEYAAMVADKVRTAADRWSATGEMPAIAEGERHAPGFSLSLKSEPGADSGTPHPLAVRGQLGPGAPIEAGLRSRMEGALSGSFGGVRLHTDARAESLASRLQARAFTIGTDVAFARGAFRPGTVEGDALLAHELAHVSQQGSGSTDTASEPLERDADRAAAGALGRLWAGERSSGARLRGGLRLQRCGAAKPRQRYDFENDFITNWDAERITAQLRRTNDQGKVNTMLDRGYTIWRFSAAYATWRFNDGRPDEERRAGGLRGMNDPNRKRIYINGNLSLEEATSNFFHEVTHFDNPDSGVDDEVSVRVATEHFRIRQGMRPVKPSYRRADGSVDEAAIRADVGGNEAYAQVESTIVGWRFDDEEEVKGFTRQ